MRVQEDFGSWFVEGEGYKDVLRYASIPIVAALIGYGTNVLAIQMTFLPLEYLGFGEAFFHKWGFSLGWQVHGTHAGHSTLRCTGRAAAGEHALPGSAGRGGHSGLVGEPVGEQVHGQLRDGRIYPVADSFPLR